MNNKRLIQIIVCTILALLISVPMIAFASPLVENSDLMARMTLDPSLKPDHSPGVIIGQDTLNTAGAETAFANYTLQVLAGGLISVAAPVAIIIIAIAGLIAVVSHGDQKLIDRAKKTLTWAIIGLLLIIFSWIIVRATISLIIDANSDAPAATSTSETENKDPDTTSEPPTSETDSEQK
jgi:lysylphosphatidylglycerol synthetase-like protein (DUF2156 family)